MQPASGLLRYLFHPTLLPCYILSSFAELLLVDNRYVTKFSTIYVFLFFNTLKQWSPFLMPVCAHAYHMSYYPPHPPYL